LKIWTKKELCYLLPWFRIRLSCCTNSSFKSVWIRLCSTLFLLYPNLVQFWGVGSRPGLVFFFLQQSDSVSETVSVTMIGFRCDSETWEVFLCKVMNSWDCVVTVFMWFEFEGKRNGWFWKEKVILEIVWSYECSWEFFRKESFWSKFGICRFWMVFVWNFVPLLESVSAPCTNDWQCTYRDKLGLWWNFLGQNCPWAEQQGPHGLKLD